MGVVGIPIFLALVAAYATGNIALEGLAVFAAVLVFYLFVYYYFRMLRASLESLLEVARFSGHPIPDLRK